ncbi:LysR substrate-binding domain-containing protein [Salinicola halophilus]|uniref:LysR substrate-binding domain-containing protein n=1 Tax=Salinicola halophilus TaxID=184065 RepID=UPI000DA1B2FC|nr:LysR substrate-binding domain-containing protein [Salinicola halophilus]
MRWSRGWRRRGGERQLPDFQRAHPDIEIRILTVQDPYRLDLGEFDLGIYYHLPNEVDPPGLHADAIFDHETVGVVCSPIYFQRHGAVADPAALLTSHTLMVVEDHYHDWLTWQRW